LKTENEIVTTNYKNITLWVKTCFNLLCSPYFPCFNLHPTPFLFLCQFATCWTVLCCRQGGC